MGAESFYVNFHVDNGYNKMEIIDLIKSHFEVVTSDHFEKRWFFKKIYCNENIYFIENYLRVNFSQETNSFFIDACFSNYIKYIHQIYDVYILLRDRHQIWVEFGDVCCKDKMKYDDFERCITTKYQLTFDGFNKRYQIDGVDARTDGHFFRNIRKLEKQTRDKRKRSGKIDLS